MATLGELIGRAPSESWRSLRRRRATLPFAGNDRARADTFRAALEQAEQQFEAAANVGYDSRPLNLFYGLSQAGRAVAAAGRAAAGDWRLEGHGILARNLEQAQSVGDVMLLSQAGRRGSFQRLSMMLDSPIPAGESTKGPIPGATAQPWALSVAWPYLFETQYSAQLDPSTQYLPIDITLPPRESVSPGGATYPHGAYMVDSIVPATARRCATGEATLSAFLDRYPAFRTRNSLGPIWGEGQFGAQWGNDENGTPTIRHDMFTLYRGQRVAFPAIAGDARALHPLMAWWTVLFGLSMLARYEPNQWSKMVDVDHHAQATSVEYVLDLALRAVPDLIDETIEQISS